MYNLEGYYYLVGANQIMKEVSVLTEMVWAMERGELSATAAQYNATVFQIEILSQVLARHNEARGLTNTLLD